MAEFRTGRTDGVRGWGAAFLGVRLGFWVLQPRERLRGRLRLGRGLRARVRVKPKGSFMLRSYLCGRQTFHRQFSGSLFFASQHKWLLILVEPIGCLLTAKEVRRKRRKAA